MATLRDIAAQASVSQTTVSKVLNNKYREFGITNDCAKRVKRIADQLGYRPNRAARATASGRFNAIGILKVNGPLGLGQLPEGLLNGIERGSEQHGLQLGFSSVPADFRTDMAKLPRILRESWADGFLLVGDWQPTAELATTVRRLKLPLITVGCEEEVDNIHPDEAGGCREAVRILIEAGHRRIGHVPDDHLPVVVQRQRAQAFMDAMAQAGLQGHVLQTPAERRRVEVYPWEERAQARRAMLQSPDRPTALVVDSVEQAYPLFHEARQLGIELPRDLAMITFHDVAASALGVCISTMLIRCGVMGDRAVGLLQERIASKEPVKSVAMAYEYLGGHTV